MVEATTLAAIRSGKDHRVINNMRRYFIGDLNLAVFLRPTENDDEQTWDLFQKVNSGKESNVISFVDCSNIILCQRHQIEQIATFNGHFEGWLQSVS
ncbi:MAG TPA: hypothetical protein VKK79_21895 [Candidatus Lokiarchaeia archaeon]|nr:hypothetical protein [Candidatus Lokiarchaeia archaeon]